MVARGGARPSEWAGACSKDRDTMRDRSNTSKEDKRNFRSFGTVPLRILLIGPEVILIPRDSLGRVKDYVLDKPLEWTTGTRVEAVRKHHANAARGPLVGLSLDVRSCDRAITRR
ncbi:hypothetical protein LIA77_11729 [Sarocladium implicatum]|nr:hypothetical protein LIA77_11729 [Sarocladium implicatum]